MDKVVGFRISLFRKKMGLTQQELSQKCGIPQPRISEIERCRNLNPKLCTLEKIAGALGVKVSDLVEEEEK